MAIILRLRQCERHRCLLPHGLADGNVPVMYPLARTLQLIGLIIPPIAIFAQLADTIKPGQMLGFLVASVALFSIGYLLQQYFSGGKS